MFFKLGKSSNKRIVSFIFCVIGVTKFKNTIVLPRKKARKVENVEALILKIVSEEKFVNLKLDKII